MWFCRDTDALGPETPHPVLSTHSEYSLSDFPYENLDRRHLPDH